MLANLVLDYLRGLHLRSRADGHGDFAYPTQAKIVKVTGYSRRGVQKALAELRDRGYLDVIRHPYVHRRKVYRVRSVVESSSVSAHEQAHRSAPISAGQAHSGAPVRDERTLVSAIMPQEKQQSATATGDKTIEEAARAVLTEACVPVARVTDHIAADPALVVVAVSYFVAERDAAKGRRELGIGLLMAFLADPEGWGFARVEAPAGASDPYAYWHPPANDPWHERRRAQEAKDHAAKVEAETSQRRELERERAAQQFLRDQHAWDALDPSDQQAIERAAVAARPTIRGKLNALRQECFDIMRRLLVASEDLACIQALSAQDRRKAEEHAAALWPLFGSRGLRDGAVIEAAKQLASDHQDAITSGTRRHAIAGGPHAR